MAYAVMAYAVMASRYLVENGAAVNAQNDKTDRAQRCTALHFAVLNIHETDSNKMAIVDLLIANGAKTDIVNADGNTVDALLSAEPDNDALRNAKAIVDAARAAADFERIVKAPTGDAKRDTLLSCVKTAVQVRYMGAYVLISFFFFSLSFFWVDSVVHEMLTDCGLT